MTKFLKNLDLSESGDGKTFSLLIHQNEFHRHEIAGPFASRFEHFAEKSNKRFLFELREKVVFFLPECSLTDLVDFFVLANIP